MASTSRAAHERYLDAFHQRWAALDGPFRPGFPPLSPKRDLGLDLDSSPDPDGLVPRTSERLHSGPHVAPQLEALIPTSLWQDGAEIDSQTASQWASGLLDRALQRLSVRPRDVVVVCGMGLREAGLIVNVYRVPGVDEVALDREFRIVITRPHRGSDMAAPHGRRSRGLVVGAACE